MKYEKQTGLFDVTMGAYDGAQITDLVGLLMLHKLQENIPQINFALCRDDGIGVYSKVSPSQMERIKIKYIRFSKTKVLK